MRSEKAPDNRGLFSLAQLTADDAADADFFLLFVVFRVIRGSDFSAGSVCSVHSVLVFGACLVRVVSCELVVTDFEQAN